MNREVSVRVVDRNGWCQIRFKLKGKQYALSTGHRFDRSDKPYAEDVARKIQRDIREGKFDETLKRYKLTDEQIEKDKILAPKLSEALEPYLVARGDAITKKTIEQYYHAWQHLTDYFDKDYRLDEINFAKAMMFKNYTARLATATRRGYLHSIKAVWNYWIKNCTDKFPNHWYDALADIRSIPKSRPDAFTIDDIQKIISWFGTHQEGQYQPLVIFLFNSGCRIGEAVGLQWKHIDMDDRFIHIEQQKTRTGEIKPPKNNKTRSFYMNDRLSTLFSYLKQQNKPQPDHFVFFITDPTLALNQLNFSSRQWKQCLEDLELPHKKLHMTRSSAITVAIASGSKPEIVAKSVGHNQQVLFDFYLRPSTDNIGVIPSL